MNLQYVPLLKIMRELQAIPRGQPPDFNGLARFKQYLRTIFPADENDEQLLPLIAMNPMGRDHVTGLLDELLAMDGDAIGAKVTADAAERLADAPGDFKIGLVVADDLKGAGTNRWDYEFTQRFGPEDYRLGRRRTERPRWMQSAWITGMLWSSEPPSERAIRDALHTAIHRAIYTQEKGPARTLRDMLAQEGQVLREAGCTTPTLEPDDLAYTREALAPLLDADDKRTGVECLFGDVAAKSLGFTPRGLSSWAGVALALHASPLASPSDRP